VEHQDASDTPAAGEDHVRVDIASDEDKLYAAIAEWMELYDEILAQQDVRPHERPLRAAVLFARHAVVRVRDQGSEEIVSNDVSLGDLINKPWFGKLVRAIERWYREVFGAEGLRPAEHIFYGAVIYRGVIQILHIPSTITKQAEVAHQLWIAFPDHIEDDEDVLSWVRPEPERTQMQPQVLADLESQVRTIAGAVRFIASRARNASKGSRELRGLLAGGVKSLEAFPHLAVVDRLERQKAWWELQMANESFLKAFCLQKGRPGGYRKIHSLQNLIRDARELGLDYVPDQFSGWPSERAMSDYRYATGRDVSSSELFSAYELTLNLCTAVASSLAVKLDTGNARFCIQPLPWRLRELGVEPGPASTAMAAVLPDRLLPDVPASEAAGAPPEATAADASNQSPELPPPSQERE
jgi:hypothetical protein